MESYSRRTGYCLLSPWAPSEMYTLLLKNKEKNFNFLFQNGEKKVLLLIECFLIKPRTEDGQRGRVMSSAFPPQRTVITPERIGGQHNGQLQLNWLLHAVRLNLKLMNKPTETKVRKLSTSWL